MDQFPGGESYPIRVPQFNEDSPNLSPISYSNKNIDKSTLWEVLDDISIIFPSMPVFEILKLYFSQPLEICPTSLVDSQSLILLETEQACREYNKLPFGGGIWDQPNIILESFSIIRTERNQYERTRFEQLDKKDKKSTEKKNNPFSSPNFDLPPLNTNLNI